MNNDEKNLLSDFAKSIYERKLSTIAIFFLESTKYLAFIGSQFLIFQGPVISSFVNEKKYYMITSLLEDRENIEFLITEIESYHFKKIENNKV